MRRLLAFTIMLLTLSSCAQEKICSDFRTGEFRYADDTMPEKIVRTESMQIETNPNNNVVVKTSVEWVSECQYILTYSEILNYPNDVSEVIGKKISCEITETNGNRVKVHAKSDSMDEIIEFIKVD